MEREEEGGLPLEDPLFSVCPAWAYTWWCDGNYVTVFHSYHLVHYGG